MTADPRYRGKVGTQLRQDEALRLWLEGKTYVEVAAELGYANHSGAHHAVTAALTRHNDLTEERAALGRQIALGRLQMLWKRAVGNALHSEGTAKDLMARLEGVKDAATEIRLTVESELDRDIAALTEALTRHGVPVAAVLDAAGR